MVGAALLLAHQPCFKLQTQPFTAVSFDFSLEVFAILFADMKDIDGKAFGQLVLQLPQDDVASVEIIRYLKSQNLSVEEVIEYVG